MGQKTHPIGFRLGATRTWSSRWFATKGYANLLHEDHKIRRFIKSSLYHAGISRIDVQSGSVATAKPGHASEPMARRPSRIRTRGTPLTSS